MSDGLTADRHPRAPRRAAGRAPAGRAGWSRPSRRWRSWPCSPAVGRAGRLALVPALGRAAAASCPAASGTPARPGSATTSPASAGTSRSRVLAGLVLGALAAWLLDRSELVTLVAVVVGSVLAAYLMLRVGLPPQPAGPRTCSPRTAADGTKLDGALARRRLAAAGARSRSARCSGWRWSTPARWADPPRSAAIRGTCRRARVEDSRSGTEPAGRLRAV